MLLQKIWARHREALSYLFFGALTTLVNIAGYWLLSRTHLDTAWANGIALEASILFAYVTNRIWVFGSRARGVDAAKELASFLLLRNAVGLVDEGIMILGVDHLGPRLFAGQVPGAWGLGVKIFANILVILLNYVLSKLVIFRKRR